MDSNGKVTAVGEGTATVTATSTFNPSITATRRFIVASPVEKPQITELNVNGKAVTLSWTESPLTNDTDVCAYEVYVYSKGTTTNPVWSDTNVTTTSCAITMMAHGEYTAFVRAVNKTESTYSKYSSQNFTILDGDWLYTDTVPENSNDAEIQYLNHYEDKEQAESPGVGWTQGASHTHYTNGDVIYSHDRMATSDTLVEIGTYYYHFCDGSSEVERFWTERFCNETNLDNNGQFDVVAEYTDSDPNYKVYRLRWNSGEWAGGLATCPYGSNDAMALYYLGYRYQQRTVNVTYTWTKEDEWSFERDPNASVTSYRIRTLTYDNQLHIPTGTTRIEAEAFMGDTTIEEVFVPIGCEYIGSKAFAGCTGLKRIHIPVNTVVEADAFEGCEQVTIVRE